MLLGYHVKDKLDDNSQIVFGDVLDEIRRFGADLKYEVYQCTRKPSDCIGEGDNLNIMHVSTDLTAIRDTITEIIDFLRLHSFIVERMNVEKNWEECDVLIIGGDNQHMNSIKKLSSALSTTQNMFDRFDILLYKLNGLTVSGWSSAEKLWFSDKLFKFECMFAIHHNLLRRIDHAINRGIVADICRDIELILNLIVDWNTKKPSIELFKMLEQFKTNIKSNDKYNECNDPNFEIFFAAMNVVRLVRNRVLHGSYRKLNNDIDTFGIFEFNEAVVKHKRVELSANPNDNNFKNEMKAVKDCVRLATCSLEWIKEYKTRYC